MREIILASQSKARKELFSSLGIPFITIPANIDEKKIRDKNLKKRAQNIADAKAAKVLSQNPDSIIIACDTFSECEGKTLEKPKSILEAKKMLKFLSGKEAVNYTAFRYIDRTKEIDFSITVKVSYTFRTLYAKEIGIYVEEFPVMEWAAGFALVHPYMMTFIAKVNGSYTGLSYGLPIEYLIPLLKRSGFEPRPIR
jgi:septum formation protein